MTENVKKLNELASANEALAKRLTEAQDREAVAAIAAEAGITLTDADFEAIEAERKSTILAQGSEELSDDELDAVAGGDTCFCVAGGGGVYRSGQDAYNQSVEDHTCGCVIFGIGDYKGYRSDGMVIEDSRCSCMGGGAGKSVLGSTKALGAPHRRDR